MSTNTSASKSTCRPPKSPIEMAPLEIWNEIFVRIDQSTVLSFAKATHNQLSPIARANMVHNFHKLPEINVSGKDFLEYYSTLFFSKRESSGGTVDWKLYKDPNKPSQSLLSAATGYRLPMQHEAATNLASLKELVGLCEQGLDRSCQTGSVDTDLDELNKKQKQRKKLPVLFNGSSIAKADEFLDWLHSDTLVHEDAVRHVLQDTKIHISVFDPFQYYDFFSGVQDLLECCNGSEIVVETREGYVCYVLEGAHTYKSMHINIHPEQGEQQSNEEDGSVHQPQIEGVAKVFGEHLAEHVFDFKDFQGRVTICDLLTNYITEDQDKEKEYKDFSMMLKKEIEKYEREENDRRGTPQESTNYWERFEELITLTWTGKE